MSVLLRVPSKAVQFCVALVVSLACTTASAQLCNKIKQGFGNCVFCDAGFKQAYILDSAGCFACLSICRLLSPVEPDPVPAAEAIGLLAASDGQVVTLATPSDADMSKNVQPLFDADTLVAIAKSNAYAAYVLRNFNPGASAPLDLAKGEGFITNAPTVETMKLLSAGKSVDAVQHTLVPVANGNIVRVAWTVTKKGGGRASGVVTATLHDATGNVLSEAAPTIFLEFAGGKSLKLIGWEFDTPNQRVAPTSK